MIDKFFKLTGFKKNKILHSKIMDGSMRLTQTHLKIKSYWNSSLRPRSLCADWFVGSRLESGWISAKDLILKIK
jgi:renalase